MTFQRARSDQHVQERLEEIISAASKIYDSVGYEGLSFSEISKFTKFTRPTIYKYFKTKEEILLRILQSDMETWLTTLLNSFKINKIYTLDEIAEIWVTAITQNGRLLNLYSILFTLIEKNVSLESLAEFKKGTLKLQVPMIELLTQLFPKAKTQDISDFTINQLALALGLYPMSQLCELQIKALEMSGAIFVAPSFKDAFKTNIYQLLYCLEQGIRCPNTISIEK